MTPAEKAADSAAELVRAGGARRGLLDHARPDGTSIFTSQHALRADLSPILNEVAGAVSSAMSVEEVLDVIVDRAKPSRSGR
ncbi:MAG TPA: hypothetical protein VFG89_03825 [Coriobacteriia bacterium]|nr:hypothetical protein [Coriobacteriia bacterium]